MLEFRMLLTYSDPSIYEQPVLVKITANTLKDAANELARQYGYVVDSVEPSVREASEIWLTNPRDGTNLKYSVHVYEIENDGH